MTEAVATDPSLRQTLTICRKLGISVRRYLGWEPRTWQKVDADGWTVTYTEPEYDLWEQMLWTAFDEWENSRCPGCHMPLSECLLDENVPASERPIYAAGHQVCLACEALEVTQMKQDYADAEWAEKHPDESRKNPRARHHRQWLVQRLR